MPIDEGSGIFIEGSSRNKKHTSPQKGPLSNGGHIYFATCVAPPQSDTRSIGYLSTEQCFVNKNLVCTLLYERVDRGDGDQLHIKRKFYMKASQPV